MTRYLLLSLAFLLVSTVAFSQTSLSGKVTEADTGEPVLFGSISLFKEGVLVTGTETDFDGNYSVSSLDPGTYDVEASYVGLQSQRIAGVVVLAGKSNKLDILMTTGVDLTEVVVLDYKVPLIEQDNTTSGAVVTADQIKNLPTKSINGLAATTAGVGSADDGGSLAIRGSRTDATNYYVDGIRVRGVVPQTEIEQMQVITGGIGAEYGDVTGGVISITTKGPSSKYSGGVELETSQYLDSYGYNLASANISGPILKNKEGQSILGFRLSGQYRSDEDDDRPAVERYIVKDEVLRGLEANPLTLLASGTSPSGEDVTTDGVDILDYTPNEKSSSLALTGKLDARLSDQIDVSLSGSYTQNENLFSPANSWITFNSHNNPTNNSSRILGNFRFRHRLGRSSGGADAEEDRSNSVIQNASYTLLFGYELSQGYSRDTRHGDDLFAYGHVGSFDYSWVPVELPSDSSYALQTPTGNFAHTDYRRVFNGYDPTTSSNPVLSNYNNLVVDTDNPNDFSAINGTFNGAVTSIWGLHTNVGQVYDNYAKSNSEYFTFTANSSFDFLPGGSDKGRHSIQFGLSYEQRFLSNYSIDPSALWTLARAQTNRHLSSINPDKKIGEFESENDAFAGILFDQFAPSVDSVFLGSGNYFFERVRALEGVANDEFFNIDALSPDQLSLDLFSAQELNDNVPTDLSYYGYDYLGNKLGNDVTFDDFFTTTDENGVRTFPVAAFQPIYWAGFLQDKFVFKDIIFRLGVRVDYYDANTKVLKDPYSVYDVMSVRDFYADGGDAIGERPVGVGDDFKVYVNGSNEVTSYREDEQWYFPDGSIANNPNVIYGTGVVQPKYYGQDEENNIRANGFDINKSFEDYKPGLNWMPRLAFSFPISTDANFFAHYDVLVQRPSSGQALTSPLDYFYIEERSNATLYRNPALRPQRTVDYEVGFQQKLSNSSALKIAAYYKEMRDMIQRREYLYVAAPINSYTTYDNQDFGTVKGFSFTYDLRRTNNLQVNATYTLQFADGTGSDADSQSGSLSRGNLRNLFPLDFDERHRINVSLDYRYSSGKTYDGPILFGKNILENTGLNLLTTVVSGRPYTAAVQPAELGGAGVAGALNGSRKPWTFRMDLRVDKDFKLSKPNSKHPLYLNVYFRVQNLLDARNVINVYSATGSAEDDGFLTSANGLDAIAQAENTQGKNVQAYLDAYQWRLVNPNLFSLPRRIYVGAVFGF